MVRKPDNLYVYTDKDGATVIGTQEAIPWDDLDEALALRYPDLFPAETPDTGEEKVA